ncbi:MAG: alpha/beta hydrolase [Desulfobacterales bacterium]|nr:alpha/beta hydrolase [Desulfobacterales bacterium]MDJ0874820.1 alpha/beta hydrolase [Desulfobacterales bacterium]MDJ0882664.1 alpha/beta hydrolase [Desulfobacterales bacterium]
MLAFLKILLPVAVVGVGLLYFFQDALIFFPQSIPPASRKQFEPHAYRVVHEGVTLQGWFVRGAVTAEKPLLVYYGGNAEEVSANLGDLRQLKAGAYLFINYRGYGDSEGKPSQAALCKDAVHILDHMVANERIPLDHMVLMGRSLGSGVAVHAAAQRKVRAVVLVTPFDSLTNVARHHYPIFPVRLLLKHPFDSLALAPAIKTPLLMLIAAHDEVIPPKFAFNLARAWGGPVQTQIIEGAGHNDIQLHQDYWKALNGFLSSPATRIE